MASNEKIPGPLERRHLIEREISEDKALALADAYIQDGRATEAVAFLEKAGAKDRLVALADDAIEAGDAFLFRIAGQALGEEFPPGKWLALAAAAEAAGKERHAESARRWAKRAEG